jgi:type VI secretion system protein ImpA
MRHDALLTPISEAEPCGPDLDEVGDDAYLNYMLKTDNLLPSRYLDFSASPQGVPFDASVIDLRGEVKAIAAFLEQSRDIRLLTVEARLQALSGQIVGFSESVQAIAALLSTYWEDVHPRGFDGDFTLRQNAVGAIDARATVVTALEYAPIVRDRRLGAITLRSFALANGTATPRDGEAILDAGSIADALRSEGNREALGAVHASLVQCQRAIATIQSAFDEATGYRFSPDFETLRGVLARLKGLIETGRTDLGGVGTASEAEAPAAEVGKQDAAAATARPAASTPTVPAGSIVVADHAGAAAALAAAEGYFMRFEPSTPALILVHQARMLVGKPLIAALDALMPDSAESASIVVDAGTGFEFSMSRMRAITDDMAAASETYGEEASDESAFPAETRQAATALIQAVSAFYRQCEPSSPIPMLLNRAERFLSQNFQAILSDLMAKRTAQE